MSASGRGLLSAERALISVSLFSRAFSSSAKVSCSPLWSISAPTWRRLTTVLGYIVAGPFRLSMTTLVPRSCGGCDPAKENLDEESAEKRTEEVSQRPGAALVERAPAGRPSHEIAYAAEMVVDLLERQLEALAADSRSSQHGDAGAAIDLTKSLSTRCGDGVLPLNRLRRTCDALGKAAFEALKAAAAATALAVGDAPSIAGQRAPPRCWQSLVQGKRRSVETRLRPGTSRRSVGRRRQQAVRQMRRSVLTPEAPR